MSSHPALLLSYSLAPVSASKGAGQSSLDLEVRVPGEVCYTKSIGSALPIDSAHHRKSAFPTKIPQSRSELSSIDIISVLMTDYLRAGVVNIARTWH